MNGTVPALSMIFMALSIVAVLAIPAALFLRLRKKHGAKGVSFFVGAAVMLVFAFVLESIAKKLIMTAPVWTSIYSRAPLLALFGGLMAGVFEETGRLTAFKTVLKNRRDNDYNALMYGAGHGGFEAVVLLLPAMMNNLAYSFMINSGSMSALTSQLPEETLAVLEQSLEQLSALPSWYFTMSIAERIAAIALHMALSVMVWFAAERGGKKILLFVLAIGIHALMDFAAAYMSLAGVQTAVIEVAVYIISVLAVGAAYTVWKRNRADLRQETAE